jgi:hypothetical protein
MESMLNANVIMDTTASYYLMWACPDFPVRPRVHWLEGIHLKLFDNYQLQCFHEMVINDDEVVQNVNNKIK